MRLIPLHEVAALAGQEIGVSAWQAVDQDQINQFAKVTGDDEWIHVDIDRANREIGGPIAQGFLTLSLLPDMWTSIARVTEYKGGFNYGMDKTRFTTPVKPEDRVRLRATMLEPVEKKGGTLVTIKCIIELENSDKPALVTDWSELYYS